MKKKRKLLQTAVHIRERAYYRVLVKRARRLAKALDASPSRRAASTAGS